jgi:hypothetical protein
MTGLFLVVALFVCLLLGVPIAVSLGFASVITLMLFSDRSGFSTPCRCTRYSPFRFLSWRER